MHPVHSVSIQKLPHAVQHQRPGSLRRRVIVPHAVLLKAGNLRHRPGRVCSDAVGIHPGMERQSPAVGRRHRIGKGINPRRQQPRSGCRRRIDPGGIIGVPMRPCMEKDGVQPLRLAGVHQRIQLYLHLLCSGAGQQPVQLQIGHPDPAHFHRRRRFLRRSGGNRNRTFCRWGAAGGQTRQQRTQPSATPSTHVIHRRIHLLLYILCQKRSSPAAIFWGLYKTFRFVVY